MAFYQGNRVVAKFNGPSGEKTIDPTMLGNGPVTLRAVGWGKGTSVANQVVADPVQLNIESTVLTRAAERPAVEKPAPRPTPEKSGPPASK